MNVVAARKGTLEEFVLSDMHNFTDIDILLFGFRVFGTVSFAEELAADKGLFYDIALLSEDLKCVIVAGCITELYGIRRKSAIVFDRGKVLGVSDMNTASASGEVLPGFGYRVYNTSRGSLGVVIDGDIMFHESFMTVAKACGDYAVALIDSEDSEVSDTMLRSAALSNGLSVVCLSDTSLTAYGVMGDVAAREKAATGRIEFKPQCVYNELLAKCRGIVL